MRPTLEYPDLSSQGSVEESSASQGEGFRMFFNDSTFSAYFVDPDGHEIPAQCVPGENGFVTASIKVGDKELRRA